MFACWVHFRWSPLKLEDMSKFVVTNPEYIKTRQVFLAEGVPGAVDATTLFKFMILKGCTRFFVQSWLLVAPLMDPSIDFKMHPALETTLGKTYALAVGPQSPEARLCIGMSV